MSDRERKKKRWPIVLAIVVAAILVVALIAVIVWNSILDTYIRRVDENAPTLSSMDIENILKETDPSGGGPVLDPEDVTTPTVPVETVPMDENVLNILLVGQDRREGAPRMHSDAMILCTFNLENKTLVMTSFLRDMWVYIPGYFNERINVPYMLDGFPLLNQTLQYNFGVSADYNIEVDFAGFEKAIDSVGGVDLVLTSKEANHLNTNNNTGWNLKEGLNHLTGEQALAYSRIRILDSDFQRTGRQRAVLNALIEKAKDLDIAQMLDLVGVLLPLVSTDMTNAEINTCIFKILPVLPELEIISQRVPIDDAFANASIQGKSVLVMDIVDLEKNQKFLTDTIGSE